jgi:hypothetical protein
LTTYKKCYCDVDEFGSKGVYCISEDRVAVTYEEGIAKAIYVTFHEYIHVIIVKCHLPWQLHDLLDLLNRMLHREYYVNRYYNKWAESR